jgi:glycine cleavage system H protein
MEFPEDLKYTATHEWVRINGKRARIGVTSFAAKELSDVVFVDLPAKDKNVSTGDEVCVVESVKAASSIYAPLEGKVVETNQALGDNPALLNESCYQEGWIYELELAENAKTDHLLTSLGYQKNLDQH